MRRSHLALLVLLATPVLRAAPALGAPLTNDPSGCGGDATSSAEVVEGRSRRGPLVAMPDSLCADLSTSARPPAIDLYAAPGLPGPYDPGYDPRGGYDAGGRGPGGLGDDGVYAPYGERLPPRPRRGN
jgi:hypothetical protein